MINEVDSFGIAEALAFCQDPANGVESFVLRPLQPLVQHVAQCVALDPICVDGALLTVFEWLKGVDSRIQDRSLRFMTDNPAIFITVSGAGKSPFLINFLVSLVLGELKEIPELVPGGMSAVVTAGSNYAGWRTLVPYLFHRTLFVWEELFLGVNKSTEKCDKKMSLEECIRMYNSMSNAGDLRAGVDGEIRSPTKVSLLAGLQYKAMHEYLGGDTKGALERFSFYLSNAATSKETLQAHRKGDRAHSAGMLRKMLTEHVKHFFPANIMESVRQASGEDAAVAGMAGSFAEAPAMAAAGAEGSASGAEGSAGRRPAKKRRAAPAPPPPVPAVANVHTVVDDRTSLVCDMICDTFRKAVPIGLVSHPFFSSALKFDQTLYRELSARTALRESFCKVVFGDSWEVKSRTHPVDIVMAEKSARCVVAMRLGVYNEMRRRARALKPQDVLPPHAGGEGVCVQSHASRRALQKVLALALEAPDGKVVYQFNRWRNVDRAYQGVGGWVSLLGEMHAKALIDTVEKANAEMVPAADAYVDGAFPAVQRGGRGGRLSGPSFTVHVQQLQQFLGVAPDQ